MAQRTESSRAGDASRVGRLEEEVEHLHKALASRDVIGQAKGILMERFKVTADEAFHLLVLASQHENVRVAELGGQLAETGEWIGPAPEDTGGL
jgi:AmiR/NasT family two-component response regulator